MQEHRAPGAGAPIVAGCVLLSWLLAAALPVAAQTVQKCIAANGHVTLTSEACGAGERLAGSYDAAPEPVTAGTAAAAGTRGGSRAPARASRTGMATRGTSARVRTATTTRARVQADRCQAARDRRERTLARVGLKRSFDLLRKLDDEVWAACR